MIWAPATVWLVVVVAKLVDSFRRSVSSGITSVCVGAAVVIGIVAAVVIYMNIVKVPARRYGHRAKRRAFTGVNARDAGVRELLEAPPGALPMHWIVSATADGIELRTNDSLARPFVMIRREQIVAASIGALAGGAFTHRSLDLEVSGASHPIKLAFLKNSRLGIGTDGRKALEIKAAGLGLDLVRLPL